MEKILGAAKREPSPEEALVEAEVKRLCTDARLRPRLIETLVKSAYNGPQLAENDMLELRWPGGDSLVTLSFLPFRFRAIVRHEFTRAASAFRIENCPWAICEGRIVIKIVSEDDLDVLTEAYESVIDATIAAEDVPDFEQVEEFDEETVIAITEEYGIAPDTVKHDAYNVAINCRLPEVLQMARDEIETFFRIRKPRVRIVYAPAPQPTEQVL